MNAKSYPYWDELILLLKNHEIKEIKGILTTPQLLDIVKWSDVVITIDSFLPHFIKYHKIDKKVVVLWGISDPELFGYKDNINLLKDKKYLRPNQYAKWDDVPNIKESWVSPDKILQSL